MTPRVVVRPMPGSTAQWPWTVSHAGRIGRGYWRWRCEACTNLGHWTTADNAHDDGRAHARNCAALKYAWIVDETRKRVGVPYEWEDSRTSITKLVDLT